MREERDGRLSGDGVPWAFVLDPAANVRALGEVQRRGLQAARDLVERALSRPEPRGGGYPGSSRVQRRPSGRSHPSRETSGLEELVAAWWEVASQVVAAIPSRADLGADSPERRGPSDAEGGAPLRPGSVIADLSETRVPSYWRVSTDTKGQLEGSPELWLRNRSTSAVDRIRLDIGDLVTGDGKVIEGRYLRLDPPELALPARSAQGVALTLLLDDALEPGIYRGVLQAEQAPRLCVVVELAVDSQDARIGSAEP
jgi:hypothetical protein